MRRISAIEPHAHEEPGVEPDDIVRLDFDQRNRRRMVFTTEAGRPILLDMSRAVHLRDGDRLRLEDGTSVRVEAIGEALLEIHAHSSAEMVRIAWHLGNRHLPTQLVPGQNGGSILIRHDHVIAEMVEGLGGHCHYLIAPFDPEGGAYSGGGHSHGDNYGQGQGQGHSHDPDHAHG